MSNKQALFQMQHALEIHDLNQFREWADKASRQGVSPDDLDNAMVFGALHTEASILQPFRMINVAAITQSPEFLRLLIEMGASIETPEPKINELL